MRTEKEDGQLSLFVPDGASSRTSPVFLTQIKERTSRSSSRRQRESAAIPFFIPRPDSGKWQPAGRILLGDSFSLAWRVLDSQLCLAKHKALNV